MDSMFVCHFVDPDLESWEILRKKGAIENGGGIDFEIRDISTSGHSVQNQGKDTY